MFVIWDGIEVSYLSGDGKLFNGSEFGITWLLTPEIQLGAYGGLGLKREMDNYSGLGSSRRF